MTLAHNMLKLTAYSLLVIYFLTSIPNIGACSGEAGTTTAVKLVSKVKQVAMDCGQELMTKGLDLLVDTPKRLLPARIKVSQGGIDVIIGAQQPKYILGDNNHQAVCVRLNKYFKEVDQNRLTVTDADGEGSLLSKFRRVKRAHFNCFDITVGFPYHRVFEEYVGMEEIHSSEKYNNHVRQWPIALKAEKKVEKQVESDDDDDDDDVTSEEAVEKLENNKPKLGKFTLKFDIVTHYQLYNFKEPCDYRGTETMEKSKQISGFDDFGAKLIKGQSEKKEAMDERKRGKEGIKKGKERIKKGKEEIKKGKEETKKRKKSVTDSEE